MNRLIAHRGNVLVGALAILALAWPAWAAKSTDFRAVGTATFVSQDESGNHFVFSQEGRATPGGNFTGTVVGHSNANFRKQSATITFDFGNGDTLTVEARLNQPEDVLTGPYVVTGGTGKYAGAEGGGSLSVFAPNEDGTRDFEFVGTLSL